MKQLVLTLSALLLAGCGSSTQLTPHISHPSRSLVTTPYVEFVGDDQIKGVVARAGNPMWRCTTCAQGQTSTQDLDKADQVVALKPNIAIILAGAYDLIDTPELLRTEPTLTNELDMQDKFRAAGIKAAICYLPESTAYDAYYFNLDLADSYDAGLVSDVISLEYTDPGGPVTDGVDFNALGLTEARDTAQQEIASFHVGGTKVVAGRADD